MAVTTGVQTKNKLLLFLGNCFSFVQCLTCIELWWKRLHDGSIKRPMVWSRVVSDLHRALVEEAALVMVQGFVDRLYR